MSVSVLVPRAGACPYRQRAWEHVRSLYEGFEVVEGWGDANHWVKADAVAEALSRATGDILVIADSDVWTDHLHEVIEAVQSGKYEWGSPHRHVWRLTEQGTAQFIAGEREDCDTEEIHEAWLGGGIVVVTRDAYERAPFDPRFVGWGGEDKAWSSALWTMAGRPFLLKRPLWHLWHPPQPRPSRYDMNDANEDLLRRYLVNRKVVFRMQDLIEEGRCHSTASSPQTR